MYEDDRIVVRAVYGNSKVFWCWGLIYIRFRSKPLLFAIVMEVISRQFQAGLPAGHRKVASAGI